MNCYSTIKAAFKLHYDCFGCGNIPKLLQVKPICLCQFVLGSFMGGTNEKNMPVYQELITSQGGPQTLLLQLQ